MKFLTCLVVLVGSSTFAAEKILTWKECVALAKENNVTIKLAESNYRAQKELEDVAFAGFLPEINASIAAAKSYAELTSNQAQDSSSASLNLNQNLFAGFIDKNKLKESQARTLSVSLDLQISKVSVSAELKQAFALLRYSYDQLDLARKILDRRKENLRIVELRYSSGLENKGSVLLSEAYFQQAQFEITQAQENYRNYRTALYLLMGLKESPEDIIIPEGLEFAVEAPKNIEFKKLVVSSNEFQKSLAVQEASKATVEKYRASFYPSLNLTGSMGKYDTQYPPNYNKWSLGLTLTIPLYSGGKDSAQVKSALEGLKADQLQTLVTENDLLDSLKSVYSKYLLSYEKLKVDQKFEQASLLRSQIGRQKYNNGMMSFEDWDKIESELIDRQKTALTSKKDILINESAWEKAKGQGVLL